MTNDKFTDSVKQKELFEYIKRQIQNGVNPEEVKNTLLKVGWQTADINKVFELLNSENNQNNSEILNSAKILERAEPKISKKTLLIFAAILLIFGIGAVVSGFFYFTSPEGILERMLVNSAKVKSAEYSGKIKINITGGSFYPMIVDENKEHYIAINFDGASDNYDENNPLGHFYFDIESDLFQKKTLFSIESRILKDNVYFKLNGLSDLGFLGVFDLSPLSGQWIDINIKNLEKQYNLQDLEQVDFKKKKLTEDDIKKLEEFLKEHRIFKEIEKLPSERVNGKDTHHLKFNIDKENLKNYISEIIKIYYKDIDKTYIEIREIQKIINNAFDTLDFSGIEVWIGKKDYLPYKFSAAIDFSDKKTKEGGKISIFASFKNYNKPVKVEIPQNAKSFEEIMKSFWSMPGFNLDLHSSPTSTLNIPPCTRTQDKNKPGCIEPDLDAKNINSSRDFWAVNMGNSIMIYWANLPVGTEKIIIYRGKSVSGPWTQIFKSQETKDTPTNTVDFINGTSNDWFYKLDALSLKGNVLKSYNILKVSKIKVSEISWD